VKVLVCGGRDFTDRALLFRTLDEIDGVIKISRILHGDSRGADRLAGLWAADRNVLCAAYPADWKLNGLRAGPIRNELMIERGKPDLVVAFPGGAGTADMVKKAMRAKVKVEIVK